MPDMLTHEVDTLDPTQAVTEAASLNPRRTPSPQRLVQINEAALLFGQALSGSRLHMQRLEESLTRSDFQHVFGEVLERELLRQYEDLPSTWSQFASRTTVRDFRPKTYVDLLGGKAELDRVAERGEYPARPLSDAEYRLQVAKYGARISLTWEMLVNDDLDSLRDTPERLAVAARDTEDLQATRLLVGADGPNASFWNAENGNLLDGNPELTEGAVEAALTKISTRRDSEGRPIFVRAAVLVVPPELQTTADRIVGVTEVRETIDGKTIVRSNPLAGRVRVVVNPWLTVVNTHANAGKTWMLLPDPSGPRPAVVMGFLRGHEVPDLRIKADAGSRPGGGQISPEEGSFEIDDIQYRVRHVVGGTQLDPKTTAISTGAGS